MITIGICDDEEIQRKNVKELCECFFLEYSEEHEYIEFSSGEEVLAYKGEKLQLLFLDVQMGGIDGLEVLKFVEDVDWIWRVVFVSSHEEAVWKAFSIKTLAFARKPIEYQQVTKWIRTAIRENRENTVFEFVTMNGREYKTIEEIYYLQAEKNYTYLYGKSVKWLINDNLKKWQNAMEQAPVIRIHKSYLVNMLHIQRWELEKVILENKVELPVGRQFAKEAKEKYYVFVKKQALGRM